MAKLQCVRGTYDLYGAAKRKTKQVVRTGEEVVEKYGFEEIETPIFEFTEVFARNLGDTSDIVTKEMYCFEDRGGESLTLRPEGTAGVVRAFVSNGMQQNLPVKFYYHGQMFRYERPQKGRQRQFTQFGVELLGADTPQADIEVIAMAYEFLEKLGLSGQVTVEVNSLGDAESRNAYREKLVAYLKEHFDELSADSKNRLERNPLRVLDSKEECDKAVVEKAPLYADSLNEKSKAFFAKVLDGLDRLGIKYRVNNRLVRGLDYYTRTTFEIVSDQIGAQGTVAGGGRYDGLVEQLGGPNVSGLGFACGMERLALLLPQPEAGADRPDFFTVVLTDVARDAALTQALRDAGFRGEMGFSSRSIKSAMRQAGKSGARFCLLIGEDELAAQTVMLKNMDSGEQSSVAFADVVARLQK